MKYGKRSGMMLVVILLLQFCIAYRAFASEETDLVVDKAGVFGNEIGRVEDAARSLREAGADVHVYTIDSFVGQASSLDDYYGQLERRYPSWRTGDGRKGNLVVFMISKKEKKTGLYFGGDLSGALEGQWGIVSKNNMNPFFRRGEFADGFVSGIREVERRYLAFLHPPADGGAAGSQVIVVDRGPERESQPMNPSKPVDLSGLWAFLSWAAGIGAGLVIVIMGYVAYGRRSESKARKQECQQRAQIEKSSASKTLRDAEEKAKTLDALVPAIASQVDASSADVLTGRLKALRSEKAGVAADLASSLTSAGDPSRDDLTEAQYSAIQERFQAVSKAAREILRKVIDFENEITQLRDLISRSAEKLQEADTSLERAQSVVKAVQDKGYRTVDADRMMSEARQAVMEIRALLEEKKYAGFATRQGELMSQIEKVEEQALSVIKRKEDIDRHAAKLQERLGVVGESIVAGREVFLSMSSGYAPSSWESVKGNGTEAENRRCRAEKAVSEAVVLADMDRQEWDAAEQALGSADAAFDEADSLIRSIISRRDDLVAAKARIEAEITEAASDIEKAKAYIDRYGADIDVSVGTGLEKAEVRLGEARKELAQERPDYIAALKAAKFANDTADGVLATSMEEHEAAERLRRKVESSWNDVKRSLSKTGNYLQDHSEDVDPAVRLKYESVQRQYANIDTTSTGMNPVVLIARLDDLYSGSEDIYRSAKDDVDQAYEARTVSWGQSASSGGGGSVNNGNDNSDRDDGGSSSSWSSGFDNSGGGGSIGFSSGDPSSPGGGTTDW